MSGGGQRRASWRCRAADRVPRRWRRQLFLEDAPAFRELVHLVVEERLGELAERSRIPGEDRRWTAHPRRTICGRFFRVEVRLLFEEAGGVARLGAGNFAIKVLVDAGENFEEGGLAGPPLMPRTPILASVEVGEEDVLEGGLFCRFFYPRRSWNR